MTFVQSKFTFGGYRFPASFYVVSDECDQVIDEAKIPYLDGTNAPPGTRNSRTIMMAGTIGGFGAVDSSGAYILTPDQAEAEAQLMKTALNAGYQQLAYDNTPARYILAQKSKLLISPHDANGRRALDVQISFLAPDPRWLSTATHSYVTTSTPTNEANNGTARSYPKWTFVATAAVTNPTLRITPAGASGYIQVALTCSLANGDTVVIDCDPRNISNAVVLTPYGGSPFARLDLLGTTGLTNTIGDGVLFPYMSPGTTNAVSSTLASGSGTGTLTWADAWL